MFFILFLKVKIPVTKYVCMHTLDIGNSHLYNTTLIAMIHHTLYTQQEIYKYKALIGYHYEKNTNNNKAA